MNALIDLSDNANRVLNVVKAKYCLKDKAQAIEFVIGKYIECEEDPELRPEYIRKIFAARKGKFIRIDDFDKYFDVQLRSRTRSRASAQKVASKKSGDVSANLPKSQRNQR